MDLKKVFVNVAVICPVNVCVTLLLNRFLERGGVYIMNSPIQSEKQVSILNPSGKREVELALMFIFQIGKENLIAWIGDYDEKEFYAMEKFLDRKLKT